jgi:tetratricopeptide (TPR) repeat protein
MITDTDREIPAVIPAGKPGRAGIRPSPVRRSRAATIKPLTLMLGACLVGFNLWWYWRDTRLLANLNTISGWIGKGQYDLAEPALMGHLRQAPNDGEARMMLARILGVRNDLLGCARQLHQVPFWWPTKAEALYREGQAYFMIDRAKDAEAAWLAVVEHDPLHPTSVEIFHDASLELLKLYSTEDRWEDAHVIIWGAYEEASPADHPILLSMRLRSELERVAPAVSIVLLQRYVAAVPTDWEALRALARAELALGRQDEANLHFQTCLKNQPENPRVWRDYLNMLNDQGDLDTLKSVLSKIPQAAESDPDIWKLRGNLKEKDRNWAGAAEDYHKALEINPYARGCHYRLAMVEQRLGHTDQATRYRKQADELREAQTQLRSGYATFLDAQANHNPGGPDLPASLRRLASLCETLGWARVAEACNQLANSS